MSIKKVKQTVKKEKSQDVMSEVLKQEKKIVTSKKSCVVCGALAEYCMRGLPNNTYCRNCAKNYFKLLNYLDKL